MKRLPLTPAQYHSLRFDVSKLPDVAAAGPVSASILSKSRDPFTFLLNVEKADTGEMQWGSLIDTLWTTPGLFDGEYVVLPPNAPQKPTQAMLDAKKPSPASIERRAWWEGWENNVRGRTIIKHEDFLNAKSAVSMLNQNALVKEIHEQSNKQVALMGDSPILPGTRAKCLFDLLPMDGPFVDAIADLKTTSSYYEKGFQDISWKFDYVVKLGYYGILAEAAGLGHRPRGILIWQNSSYPYQCCVREISKSDMDIGRQVAINRVNALSKLDATRLSDHFDTTLKTQELADWQRNAYITT